MLVMKPRPMITHDPMPKIDPLAGFIIVHTILTIQLKMCVQHRGQ